MHVFFIRPEQALIQVFSLVLRIRSKASIEEKKAGQNTRRKKGFFLLSQPIQEEPIMLDESGLLVVLFRVRTTLLRSAFSFSSLSRRASSSGSWLASAFCGIWMGYIVWKLKEKSGKKITAPHSCFSAAQLPLDL